MITIPIKPISTNRLFQGRRFKTKEYDQFIETALYLCPKIPILKGAVSLECNFYIKRDKVSDLDNFLKAVLDLIVRAGYIEDDRFIYRIIAKKFKSNNERIELNIKPYRKKYESS